MGWLNKETEHSSLSAEYKSTYNLHIIVLFVVFPTFQSFTLPPLRTLYCLFEMCSVNKVFLTFQKSEVDDILDMTKRKTDLSQPL